MRTLSESAFFVAGLDEYLSHLIKVLDYVIDNYGSIPPDISRKVSRIIWETNKYISGSTSNKIPYEIVYSLEKALSNWTKEKHIITTALLEEPSFHFYGMNPGSEINQILPFQINFNLIQIALPRIYRHKYLYCIALYHELGHYIDYLFRLTEYTLIIDNCSDIKECYHRREYFADLFAASYVGDAINTFLLMFAGQVGESDTHPSTQKRIDVVNLFLSNGHSAEIDRITNALGVRNLPKLEKRFVVPEINKYFDNITPFCIEKIEELHGIIPASWNYLEKTLSTMSKPWADMGEYKSEKVINDLTEKSVRNWMISERWKHATSS